MERCLHVYICNLHNRELAKGFLNQIKLNIFLIYFDDISQHSLPSPTNAARLRRRVSNRIPVNWWWTRLSERFGETVWVGWGGWWKK